MRSDAVPTPGLLTLTRRVRGAAAKGLASAAICLLALAGCVADQGVPLSGPLNVYASTSLTEAITSMAHGFETTYPAVRVAVTYGADTELARKAAQGPAPDVIALEGAAPLATAGPMGPVVKFARNQLVLAVPANNPKGVLRLADVGRPDLRVVLCAETEPCGAVATSVLAAANVTVPASATRAPDVRSVLAALKDGTADAALVYRSDARLAGDSVATVEFPESRVALAEYQAAVPSGTANRPAAEAFLAYLGSQSTLEALTNGGFQPPA